MGTLHKDLTGADLHIPGTHAASHLPGGSDPISSLAPVILAISSNHSVAATDDILGCTGDIYVYLPDASTFGKTLIVKNIGTGTVTVDAISGQLIDGQTSVALNDQYESITLAPLGANWMII